MEKIPILKMGPFLLVTIQVDLYDRLALNLESDLIQMINKVGSKGVLIDISAVNIVDSFMGRILGNIASMSRILDAQTVVVGMQPAVAITLVELGLPLNGVRTALNVDPTTTQITAVSDQLPTVLHGIPLDLRDVRVP